MAQVDLAVYRYALFLRSLIYKKLRHDENPSDSRFPWDASDEKAVAKLMVFLRLEVSSEFGSPLFYPQALDAVQQLVNDYNQVDISNRPPPDVITAYEKHLQALENQTTTAVDSTLLKQAKGQLRRRVSTTLPQVDPQTLDYLVTTILAEATTGEPEASVSQASQIVSDTATVTGQAVSDEELVATVSAAAPIWNSTSTDFAAVEHGVNEKLNTGQPPEDKVAEAAVVFVTDYVSTAVFSPSPSVTPSPQFESSAVTATQSPPTAARAAQILTDRQIQISTLVGQLRQALSESGQIEANVHKQLSLNPDLKGESLKQTSVVVAQFVLPAVLVGHQAASQAGLPPSQVKAIDKFLAQIGYHQGLQELGITNITTSARAAAQKAVGNLDFSQLLVSTPNTQVFYSLKATSSPQLRGFFQDLQALETIDFASVATVADRHFDLSGIDASLDKYFDNTGLRDSARMQNFGGDIIARFVPGAEPIVAVLKPINKLFFLIIDKTIGPFLTTVGKGIRNLMLAVFGVGAVSGVVAIYTGALAHRLSVSLRSLPAKISAATAAAGTAVVTSFAGFLTVTFIVFLSLPIAIALILFIINNSAYIVPQAVGTISGGISPADCNLQCLQFSGFTGQEQAQIESAACTLLANSCFASSLCAAGPITISRVNRDLGYCGRQTAARAIEVYNGGVGGEKCNALYTLSHELGHVYGSTKPSYGTNYATTVLPRRSTCLSTYELYDNNDPVACKVKGESGSGEDQAEIVAQWFINQALLQQYTPQWELAQMELACTAAPSITTAYVAEGPLSTVKISSIGEIDSPSPTCSWGRNLTAAINANYFKNDLTPVGWAGWGGQTQNYGCGNSCASLVFNGSSILSLNQITSNPTMAVSGLSLQAASTQWTNRTALGLKGNTVYLVVIPNATAEQLSSFMANTLQVSSGLQLDGGSSTTFCQNGSLKYGSNATVPVSIGLTSATVRTYDLP